VSDGTRLRLAVVVEHRAPALRALIGYVQAQRPAAISLLEIRDLRLVFSRKLKVSDPLVFERPGRRYRHRGSPVNRHCHLYRGLCEVYQMRHAENAAHCAVSEGSRVFA